MPVGDIITLTPEQQAALVPDTPAAPQGEDLDPLLHLDAAGLADLSVQSKGDFNPVHAFRARKDLWKDPALVQKVADANNLVKQRGFDWSDLASWRTAKHAFKAVKDVGVGAAKQAYNYAQALVGAPLVSAITSAIPGGPDITPELATLSQRQVAENIAGTETAVTGLAQMAERGVRKIGRALPGVKSLADFSPDEKRADLWRDLGNAETLDAATSGKGAFLSSPVVGQQVVKELEAQKLPVRPEEASQLAAGDPVSFWLFGKAFRGAGAAVPAVAKAAIERGAVAAGQKVAQAAGAAATGAGKAVQITGKAVEKAGPGTLTLAGAGLGFAKGGPLGALYGAAGGAVTKGFVRKGGRIAQASGAQLAEAGQQLAGAAPVRSGLVQAARDVALTAPRAALDVAEGAGLDIATAAATSERPEETQAAVSLGTALGLGKAGLRTGRSVVSGQIAAPRDWSAPGAAVQQKSSFAPLAAMHERAVAAPEAGAGTVARVNAIRQLLGKTDTEFYLADSPQGMEQALLDLGVNAKDAAEKSQRAGLFTTTLRDAYGQQRRVIVATDIDAAPHESFHAIQDVLGEGVNRAELDPLVKQAFADRWDTEGIKYAARLAGVSPQEFVKSGRNWREIVAEDSGWIRAEVGEKMRRDVASKFQSPETQAIPAEADVQRATASLWRDWQDAGANWRDVFSAEEQQAVLQDVSDRYLAREIAAEHFDVAFKNLGSALRRTDLTGRLANVAAKAIRLFGGEPLAGRTSDFGAVPLRSDVLSAVTARGREATPGQPVVTPKAAPAGRPAVTPPPVPETPAPKAGDTQAVDDWLAKTPQTSHTEAAKALNQAAAAGQGVRVSYWGAKGEPGGDPAALRPARRAEIEAQRDAQNKDRDLVTKDFFPYQVVLTSKGPQFLGWSPNNFNANVARLTAWLQKNPEVARTVSLPYDITTPEGVASLQNDLQVFMRNQQAGFTGAGQALSVPPAITAKGQFRAPEVTGVAPTALPQERADLVNYLFGLKLPETPRVTGGKIPLNVAGQKIAEATLPGRTVEPARPRGEFRGAGAKAAGVEGERILEVNPLRQGIEQYAKSAGVKPPEFIEASQRLNMNRLADATIAPELTPFGGNVLTLEAGFQPQRAAEPQWEVRGMRSGQRETLRVRAEDQAAARRAAEAQGLGRIENVRAAEGPEEIRLTGQLQPGKIPTVDEVRNATPEVWRAATSSYKSEKFSGGLTGMAQDLGASLRTPEQLSELIAAEQTHREAAQTAVREKRFAQAILETSKAQFFREAVETATGAGSAAFIREHYDRNFVAPFEGGELGGQSQPLRAQAEAQWEVRGMRGGTRETVRVSAEDPAAARRAAEARGLGRIENVRSAEGPEEIRLTGQLQPAKLRKEGSRTIDENVEDVVTKYEEQSGIQRPKDFSYAPVDETRAKGLADWYSSAKSTPDAPEVKRSYDAFKRETKAQFDALKEAGYTIEPWTQEGQPYASSAEMLADVRNNKHLWFFLTEKGFGETPSAANHPLLEDSGVTLNGVTLSYNDLFRGVHDLIGHGFKGNQFGPRGEFNAWRDHAELYSDAALPSMSAETLAQNSWVNFGPHMRNAKGELLKPGDEGYLGPANRPFAEQKAVILPDQLRTDVTLEGQAQPKRQKGDKWAMPAKVSAGFKKAWILPDGTPVQLGGKWHHQWLAENPEVTKRYNLTIPEFSGNDAEGVRESALRTGFVRLNYDVNNGTLVVEARAKDWRKQKDRVQQFIESNLDDIDNVRVSLTDESATKTLDSASARLFQYDDPLEKLQHLPFISEGEARTGLSGQAQPAKLTGETRELFSTFETGLPERIYDREAINTMSREELAAHFPEAIVPELTKTGAEQELSSNITQSPLFKQAASREEAVKLFADKLVAMGEQFKDTQLWKDGAGWYSDIVPRFQKLFGENSDKFVELLAATSPRNKPSDNFALAYDAFRSWQDGRFNKQISKYYDGLEKIANGKWKTWIEKEVKEGRVENPPKKLTPATFLATWVAKYDLIPKKTNGKLYGMHSMPVMQVLANTWLNQNTGPKTRNFVENLQGKSHRATIDLWADRTLRRFGYGDSGERWRILPKNVKGVKDEDFTFAQDVFDAAAERLGMSADALQAAAWFAEKALWAKNGWGQLDLGDYRKEIDKVPLLEKKYVEATRVVRFNPKDPNQLPLITKKKQ